jgi:hypothetical protein
MLVPFRRELLYQPSVSTFWKSEFVTEEEKLYVDPVDSSLFLMRYDERYAERPHDIRCLHKSKDWVCADPESVVELKSFYALVHTPVCRPRLGLYQGVTTTRTSVY